MKALLASVMSFLALGSPVLAADFQFNRHVGNVYVGKAQVYKNNLNGVTAVANVNMPTCDNFSYLSGYITFNFISEDGGYFNNYRFYVDGYEGDNNVKAFVNIENSPMSDRGYLQIIDNTYCAVFY